MHPHKIKKNTTTIVQASSAGSKSLIILSAMGFVSATYSENFSSEQPTATPSPIRDKFAEGRKDLTNPKAWAKYSLDVSEKRLLSRWGLHEDAPTNSCCQHLLPRPSRRLLVPQPQDQQTARPSDLDQLPSHWSAAYFQPSANQNQLGS